jgi:rhodanese-related sulfurtransferase
MKKTTINNDGFGYANLSISSMTKKIKFVLIAQNSKQAKLAAHILKDQRGYKQPLYLKGGIDTWINSERKMLMIK